MQKRWGKETTVLVSQPHVERLCRYHTYLIESLHKQGSDLKTKRVGSILACSLDSVKEIWEKRMLTKLTSNMHIFPHVAVKAPSSSLQHKEPDRSLFILTAITL